MLLFLLVLYLKVMHCYIRPCSFKEQLGKNAYAQHEALFLKQMMSDKQQNLQKRHLDATADRPRGFLPKSKEEHAL